MYVKMESVGESSSERIQAVESMSPSFIFKSRKMQEIYDLVQRIAPYPTSILLTGPSGSGKEVIANLIHQFSDRKDRPFIKVDCGAIPEPLLESELFGYEKGAFTGANREGKMGLLEMANGGTILLDEIGELPFSLQVKLLRVLQEKQIRRIGGNRLQKLDIRILSATNQDLKKRMQEGKFREDLYYRLQVIEIAVPPLAERREDIEVLIDHFFHLFCRKFRIEKQLSSDTIEVLKNYDWPGNVRELKNLMENLIVSVPFTVIEPSHLPPHLHRPCQDPGQSLKERVLEYEKRLVREAIEKHGSIRMAAQELGIDHSTLLKKMKRWGWKS
jgi:transcriptional regulator with PAS, ATPase and Fis domain